MKKILIVDDEVTSLKMLSLAVGGSKHKLLLAKNGAEALKLAKEEKPDLVLMDIMLPRMNGYEVTRVLKGDAETRHIPVIAITARTIDYDEEMAREAGCEGYLTKPFRVGSLREYLATWLKD